MNYKEYKGVIIRDDPIYESTDRGMVNECLQNYTYFSLDENSVVLDLGVHCGGFAHICKEANVKAYLGIEALKSNYECALNNMPENGKILNAAVSNSEDPEIAFYIRNSKQFSCSATVNPAKVTKALTKTVVKNLNIHTILSMWKYTHIKMDIEGAEKDFLNENFIVPNSVEEMSLEVHSEKYILDFEANYQKYILAQGFELVSATPNYGFVGKDPVMREAFGVEYTGSLFGFDLFYRRKVD